MVPHNLVEFDRPQGWTPIHDWTAMGLGYRDDGVKRSMRLALYYPDPTHAASDGPELVRRMEDYQSTVFYSEGIGRKIFAEGWAELSWDHMPSGTGSVLVVTVDFIDHPLVPWLEFLDSKDLGFLIT